MTDYCEGGELFSHIDEQGPLPEHDCARITHKLILALLHLHSHNICHRDLKSENILFTSHNPAEADIKLIDYGLSKILTGADELMTTRIGTPYYVSPEVLLGEQPYDMRCDLWSLGVVVFFTLFGYPPFYGSNQASLFKRILKGEFSFVEGDIQISSEAKDFIRSLLKLDPAERMGLREALAHPWI